MPVGDSPPFSLSGAKEKRPRAPAIHSICTHPYLSLPLPLQLPPNIPDYPLFSLLPPMVSLGEGFPHPKPRLPPHLLEKEGVWPRHWTCFLLGTSLEAYLEGTRCKLKTAFDPACLWWTDEKGYKAKTKAGLRFQGTQSKGRWALLSARLHRPQRARVFPNLLISTPQHGAKLHVIYPVVRRQPNFSDLGLHSWIFTFFYI